MTEEQIAEQYKKKTTQFRFSAVQNGIVPQTRFELDKNTAYVRSIQLGGNDLAKIQFRGFMGIRIGGDVLLEADTTTQHILEKRGRTLELGEVKPGNFAVDVTFRDEDNAITPWTGGYDVYLLIEQLIPKRP